MTVRLDKNEMYKPPPGKIVEYIKRSINEINRYTPQEEVNRLLKQLALYTKSPIESIILSSGSDLLIKEFIFLFSNNRQIIIAEPTFVVINNAAQNTESSLVKLRLHEPDFKLSLEPLMNELDKPSLLVFDNPNNPTGRLIIDRAQIERLLQFDDIILMIDEAYFEFSKVSFVNLIEKYPNIAIVRTLSKSFGLAGSGIGYLIAGDLIRKKFQGLDIMLPYPSVIAGINALRHQDYMIDYVNEVQNEKKRITKYLSELNITCFPSYANFVLVKTTKPHISQILAKHGILVHDVSNQLSSEFIRVTIGSKEENDYFLRAIEKILV